jgi:SAM-dependent methyltransferase
MLFPDYERALLRAVPRPCRRALDVGCGHGRFARRLAEFADEVDAIDRVDLGASGPPNLKFVRGDFLSQPITPARYDFVCAIASLHHLPFSEAIERMKILLRPGGVLGIIGLFRDATVGDFLWSAAAFPVSRIERLVHRGKRSLAPLREPRMTLAEIRDESARLLPGAILERRLLWRYTLLWTRPRE